MLLGAVATIYRCGDCCCCNFFPCVLASSTFCACMHVYMCVCVLFVYCRCRSLIDYNNNFFPSRVHVRAFFFLGCQFAACIHYSLSRVLCVFFSLHFWCVSLFNSCFLLTININIPLLIHSVLMLQPYIRFTFGALKLHFQFDFICEEYDDGKTTTKTTKQAMLTSFKRF